MARLALAAFLAINVMMFSMVLWTRDVYAVDGTHHVATLLDDLLRYLCMLLSLPVLLLLGGPIVEETVAAVRARRWTTDALLLLGIVASFGYSIVSVLRGDGHVYFEVGCVILIAVTLGRWLEATAKQKTTAALAALERLLPNEVRVVRNGEEVKTSLTSIVVGDVLRFLAGERIAVDGIVVHHSAAVDEQLITGESHAVEKRPGDRVFAGSLDLDGELLIQATAPAGQGTLQSIVNSVRAAALRKDHYQRLADRVAAWFTPLVILTALGTFLYHANSDTLIDGLLAAVAVVLIACPCALGLATPMALWAALANAARHQVLFRDGDALARLANIDAIAFDKTGTLTTGKARVVRLVLAAEAKTAAVQDIAAALARGSNHPLSLAVAAYAARECTISSNDYATDGVRSLPGLGVAARFDCLQGEAALGSPRFMTQRQFRPDSAIEDSIATAAQQSLAVACIGWRGRVQGCFLFAERPRSEALQAIAELRQRGLRVCILTGDLLSRCTELRDAGLTVHAELLPDDKMAAIDSLRDHRAAPGLFARRRGVGMVGDGVNDAPALAAADVGVALGCGADVARATAGVCLLSDDLLRLPWAVDLARRTVKTIRWNLAFAFLYNVVGVALATTGQLNPIVAAIAMTASSLLVVSNSLRLGHAVDSEANPLAPAVSASSVIPSEANEIAEGDIAKIAISQRL